MTKVTSVSRNGPEKATGFQSTMAVYFAFIRWSDSTLTVTLMRNPPLTTLSNPIGVAIDDQQVGQIRSNASGRTRLEFHVTAG